MQWGCGYAGVKSSSWAAEQEMQEKDFIIFLVFVFILALVCDLYYDLIVDKQGVFYSPPLKSSCQLLRNYIKF